MQGSLLGNEVRRTEDPRLLTGEARFMADLVLGSPIASVVFVRSPVAHARLRAIDTDVASAMPGVVAVLTAPDLDLRPMRSFEMVPEAFARPPVATDTVRFVGEIVAVVVAETTAQAVDAAEHVVVDYEPLPVVVDPAGALAPGAPVLFAEAGTNVCFGGVRPGGEDVLDGADVVARGRFVNQRLAAVPMEVNGSAAAPDPSTGGVHLWASCQGAHNVRGPVAAAIGIEPALLRVSCPAVGGGFGAKGAAYSEQAIVAALAHRLQRAVRHVETRSENLVAMVHGRGQVQDVEIGGTRDGTITGLRATVTADAGAYPGIGAVLPFVTRQMGCGVYAIPNAYVTFEAVVTNTTPVGAYRGAGRPEAAAMIERAVDLFAHELGMDPVDVRRRNLIAPDAFPHTTVLGATYDSGDYAAALDEAVRLARYDERRDEQRARRDRGDRVQLGIGVSCYVEVTAFGGSGEFGSIDVLPDGTVEVLTGSSPHGQGHETAFAQIAASVLGVPLAAVVVRHSDTAIVPRGGGTGGSRSLQIGGSAVHEASVALFDKTRRTAADLLEAAPEDIVSFDDGRVGVAGSPASALTLADVAANADGGLRTELDFEQAGGSYPFGAHVAVVDVDTETGAVRLVDHVAVDDCGRIVNPMLVRGQQHGGVGQGAAQALFEQVVYDTDGNPQTSTLATYAMPSAAELPSFVTANTQTPSPLNPLGAKGIGESGTIGSTPAIHNAVVDALAHLGVVHVDMPLTPERVWSAIHHR